ncbi:MAG: hypothetical protein QM703_18450 [Gemmatales bacterium]
MKRRWHPLRLIFSSLLLALAIFLYVYWPIQPRWQIPDDQYSLLGFNESLNVLFVAPRLSRTVHGPIDIEKELEKLDANSMKEPGKSPAFHIHGVNLSDGSLAFTHQVPFSGKLPIGIITSANGQVAAFDDHDLKKLIVFNPTTGQLLHELPYNDQGDGYYARPFSDDGRYLIHMLKEKWQVWELEDSLWLKEIVVADLHLATIREENRTLVQTFDSPTEAACFSHDNRYLACAMNHVLTVFEVSTMKQIGQAVSQGNPQFLADGTLAMIHTQYRALKPLASHFRISDGKLITIMSDQKNEPVHHLEMTRHATSYITAQLIEPDWTWPEWTPQWVRSKGEEWFSVMKNKWGLSLRDLTTGRMITHLRFVRNADQPMVGFCGTGMRNEVLHSYVPPPLFQVLATPDNRWLVKQSHTSLELWPVLTAWRPWYCWLIVVVIGCTALWLIFSPRLQAGVRHADE